MYTGQASKHEYIVYTGQVSDVQKYAEDVWKLEQEIAAISVFPLERTDPEKYYNEMTLEQAQALIDQGQHRTPSNVAINISAITNLFPIPRNLKAIVAVPDYFRKIGGIVRRASAETLATFMVWSVLQSVASKAGAPFKLAQRTWRSCIDRTMSDLDSVTSTLYVDKYVSDAEKKRVAGLLKTFQDSLVDLLDNNDWMDSTTKKRAKEKARAVVGNVAIENLSGKPQEIDDKYENLKVTDDPSMNLINFLMFKQINFRTTNALSETEDRIDMRMELQVNAFYSATANQIIIEAALLEKPLYEQSYPASLIFGSVGYIIGHEYMHGFDSNGRYYDKDGNMLNWWSKDAVKEFDKRAKCLIDQYNKYEMFGNKQDGLMTLGENIADLGGAKLSYSTYKKWIKDRSDNKDQLLPGLGLTQSQQFFLAMGQTWCQKATKLDIQQTTLTDDHSTGRFRINGVLRNLPEFAKAFSCSSKDKMNPKDKCELY